MSYQVVIPVIISFVISAVLGPIVISVFTKIKSGADGKRRIEVPFKKDGNTDYGWDYHTCKCDTDLSDICKGLSEDHTDLICDRGLWNRRIFR